jgi:hypothetical protein
MQTVYGLHKWLKFLLFYFNNSRFYKMTFLFNLSVTGCSVLFKMNWYNFTASKFQHLRYAVPSK